MTTSRLVKTIVFVVLLVAASSYFANVSGRIGQMGDAILVLSIHTLYPLIWLLLGLVLVTIAAGLVAALVRPLWICFVAFALASLAALLIWRLNLIAVVLALLYLLAGLLYTRGVAKGLNERTNFSVRPIRDNQTVLTVVLVIAACSLFYFGYAAQIEHDGFTMPSFVTNIATGIIEEQIAADPELTPQEREEAIAEFRQQFELQLEDIIKPYQRVIPIGMAVVLLGILATIVEVFSWLPSLILRGIFAIFTARHITTVVIEMQEVKRLTID